MAFISYRQLSLEQRKTFKIVLLTLLFISISAVTGTLFDSKLLKGISVAFGILSGLLPLWGLLYRHSSPIIPTSQIPGSSRLYVSPYVDNQTHTGARPQAALSRSSLPIPPSPSLPQSTGSYYNVNIASGRQAADIDFSEIRQRRTHNHDNNDSDSMPDIMSVSDSDSEDRNVDADGDEEGSDSDEGDESDGANKIGSDEMDMRKAVVRGDGSLQSAPQLSFAGFKGYWEGKRVMEGGPLVVINRITGVEAIVKQNASVPSRSVSPFLGAHDRVDPAIQADQMRAQGNILFKNNDYEGAVFCYTSAIEMKSEPLYFSNRAAAYIAMKCFRMALEDCQRAMAFDLPLSHPQVIVRLARCQLALGFPMPARLSLDRILYDNPQYDPVLRLLAQIQQFENHLKNFENAKLNHDWGMARLALSQCMRGVEAEGEEIPIQLRLWEVELALARESWDVAEKTSKIALLLHPKSPDVLSLRGLVLLYRGAFTIALSIVSEALRFDPGYQSAVLLRKRIKKLEAWVEAGSIMYKAGQFQEAQEIYSKALNHIRMDTGGKGSKLCIKIMYSLAFAAFHLEDCQDILSEIDASLALLPTTLDGLLMRARISQHMKQYDAAVELLELAAHKATAENRPSMSKYLSTLSKTARAQPLSKHIDSLEKVTSYLSPASASFWPTRDDIEQADSMLPQVNSNNKDKHRHHLYGTPNNASTGQNETARELLDYCYSAAIQSSMLDPELRGLLFQPLASLKNSGDNNSTRTDTTEAISTWVYNPGNLFWLQGIGGIGKSTITLGEETDVRETWFPGTHADIGGDSQQGSKPLNISWESPDILRAIERRFGGAPAVDDGDDEMCSSDVETRGDAIPEDEYGLESDDIELVMNQVNCTRADAVRALKIHAGDVIEAIMELAG